MTWFVLRRRQCRSEAAYGSAHRRTCQGYCVRCSVLVNGYGDLCHRDDEIGSKDAWK